MTLVLFLGVLFLGILIGLPVAFALLLAAMALMLHLGSFSPDILAQGLVNGVDSFPLLAIPFFILAGVIMEKAGIAERIITLIKQLVGDMTGGLAVATVIVAAFWGAVSGSGPATVAALGLILIPGMAEAGYDKAFAAAVVSVASGLAIIIPPSISFIVYGDIMQQSVGTLFAAGVIPGIVVACFLCVAVYLVSRKRGYKGLPRGNASVVLRAVRDAFWGLFTPVIILGGIYGGIFTPTEAGAVAVVYSFLVSVLIFKELDLKTMKTVIINAGISTSVVFFVIATSQSMSWLITVSQVSSKIAAWIVSVSSTPFILVTMINLILLFLGVFLETQAIILLMAPLLLPITAAIGMDPLMLGIIMVVNTSVGMITPPMAVNLFVAMSLVKEENVRLEQITRKILGFIAAEIVAIMLISNFPVLSLGILKLVK